MGFRKLKRDAAIEPLEALLEDESRLCYGHGALNASIALKVNN